MEAPAPNCPDLESLIALFYPNPKDLGTFQPIRPNEIPAPYGQLLDHNHHMTVTVEAFHQAPVDVQVLAAKNVDERYCRKILLATRKEASAAATGKSAAAPGKVVQFGIVRLNLEALDPAVREPILTQRAPLGRVLIENDVMREVKLSQLYRVKCGDDLSFLLRVPAQAITFGRTALIYCNEEPAIELLEIVAPVPSSAGTS